MRKRKLPPDNRFDWRDPDMPAYEEGFHSPEKIQQMAQRRLTSSFGPIGERIFPSYKNDPSYWWSRKRKL